MFEEEKSALEMAEKHYIKTKSALLEKATISALKVLLGILFISEVGILGIVASLGKESVYLLYAVGIIAGAMDTVAVHKFLKKSTKYQKDYPEINKLSIEELQVEEEQAWQEVNAIRRHLECKMSGSISEKKVENYQQCQNKIEESYPSQKEKQLVKKR